MSGPNLSPSLSSLVSASIHIILFSFQDRSVRAMKAPQFSLRLLLLVSILLAMIFATIGTKLQYHRERQWWLEQQGDPMFDHFGVPNLP